MARSRTPKWKVERKIEDGWIGGVLCGCSLSAIRIEGRGESYRMTGRRSETEADESPMWMLLSEVRTAGRGESYVDAPLRDSNRRPRRVLSDAPVGSADLENLRGGFLMDVEPSV